MGTIFVDKIKNGAGGATVQVDEIVNVSGDSDSGINLATNDNIKFNIAGSQKAAIDSSGNLLVGTTNVDIRGSSSDEGLVYRAGASLELSMDGGNAMNINRLSSDGTLIECRKDGTIKGKIDVGSASIAIFATGVNNGGWSFGDGAAILPMKDSGLADNNMDLGASSNRMDDIFATNGTIQTSDQNEKQDIASATTKELNVAKKLSALFKTFRWKDKVTEKGDKARTHTGIVAQEVQTAFKEEGLDASDYGLFTSGTWINEEGKEQTRLGVRYPELFSFIFSSIEARLSALEAK